MSPVKKISSYVIIFCTSTAGSSTILLPRKNPATGTVSRPGWWPTCAKPALCVSVFLFPSVSTAASSPALVIIVCGARVVCSTHNQTTHTHYTTTTTATSTKHGESFHIGTRVDCLVAIGFHFAASANEIVVILFFFFSNNIF